MAYIGSIAGKCTGSNSSKYSVWVDWITNSQSTSGNKSNVTVTMKVQRNDGIAQSAYNLNSTNPVSLSVGGIVRVSQKIPIDTRNNKIVTLATWTGDVPHNNDGTLSFSIAGSFSISGTTTLTGGSLSGYAALNPISRYPGSAATCTATQAYNRGTVTIAWSGAYGVITGYKIERSATGRNDSVYGAWELVKTITSSATSGSTTDTVPAAYMSGTKFKYRVTALNGSLASTSKESNILTVRGGIRIKYNNVWVIGTVWVNVNGTWYRVKLLSVNTNGIWREST